MNRSLSKHEQLRLLGDCCNGTLDAEQTDQLDWLLRNDEQFVGLYCDYLLLHASLFDESTMLDEDASNPEAAEEMEVSAAGSLLQSTQASPAPVVYDLSPEEERYSQGWLGQLPQHPGTIAGGTGFSQRFSWRAVLFVAATLLGVALVASWATYALFFANGGDLLASNNGEISTSTGPKVVARITSTYNCLWENGKSHKEKSEVGYGTGLVAGQHLQLREGLVEITFLDGATVLMEGPTSFAVDASDRVALEAGRLAAVVPQHARGFRVHTQGLDVFDVGTEYGVLAQESGAAEIHAFNGLVKADVLDAEGHAWRRLELNASEAARVSPVSTTILEFPADEGKFIRNMFPSAGPHDGLLAYESFDYPSGPLSAQNGGFGWAGPWFNIAAEQEAGPDSNGVATGSLTMPGIIPLGNRAVQSAHANRIRRSLATSVGGVFESAGLVENQDGVRLVGRDGNTIYLSFTQRISETDDGFYGLELHRGDGNGNRVLCVGNGAEGTGYGATSNVNIYGKQNFPTLGVENRNTNFFVVKFTFGVDNRDCVEIYRNPESLRDEQDCRIDAVLKGNFAFDRISLGNFDGTKVHEVDEIRLGTHFLAVTGRWGGNRSRLLQRITYQPFEEIEMRGLGHGKHSLAAQGDPLVGKLVPLATFGMR